jgi:hypothetical protein
MIIVIAGKRSACPNERQKDSRRVSNLVLRRTPVLLSVRGIGLEMLGPASGSDREQDHRTTGLDARVGTFR